MLYTLQLKREISITESAFTYTLVQVPTSLAESV